MDNPFIMFVSVFLGTMISRAITDWLFKHKDKEKLEQAKEIINEFMRISVASVEEYEPEFTELIGQAEQFLKEIEK